MCGGDGTAMEPVAYVRRRRPQVDPLGTCRQRFVEHPSKISGAGTRTVEVLACTSARLADRARSLRDESVGRDDRGVTLMGPEALSEGGIDAGRPRGLIEKVSSVARPAWRGPSGFQAALAALDNQIVMLPRTIRARS